MKIIRATTEDVPRIAECARMYTDVIPTCEFNEEFYLAQWRRFMASGVGGIFLLVDDGNTQVFGGIGGIIHPDLLTGKLTAVELFWYVKPEYRSGGVRLLKTFEEWAKSRDCKVIAMICLSCSMMDKLDDFYRKAGYTLLEKHYIKEV